MGDLLNPGAPSGYFSCQEWCMVEKTNEACITISSTRFISAATTQLTCSTSPSPFYNRRVHKGNTYTQQPAIPFEMHNSRHGRRVNWNLSRLKKHTKQSRTEQTKRARHITTLMLHCTCDARSALQVNYIFPGLPAISSALEPVRRYTRLH
jgi:hypothetical protein